MKKGKRTLKNAENIVQVFDNGKVEDLKLLKILRLRKEDENLSSAEFKKLMGWK